MKHYYHQCRTVPDVRKSGKTDSLVLKNDSYLNQNHRLWQPNHALGREPCMAYLSWGDEFQAFWYEKARQIKTGQNIYIELCTLHGNHNSYAETQSINACFPQLLVCARSTHSSAQTQWSPLLLNGLKTDMTGIPNAHRVHFCLCIDCT